MKCETTVIAGLEIPIFIRSDCKSARTSNCRQQKNRTPYLRSSLDIESDFCEKTMKAVLIALIFKIAACLAVAGMFCAVVYVLSLCALCSMPNWQMFRAAAVIVFAFVVIRDTYCYIKDK